MKILRPESAIKPQIWSHNFSALHLSHRSNAKEFHDFRWYVHPTLRQIRQVLRPAPQGLIHGPRAHKHVIGREENVDAEVQKHIWIPRDLNPRGADPEGEEQGVEDPGEGPGYEGERP